MKMYVGSRTGFPQPACDVVVAEGEGMRFLEPRLDVRRHSPAGFEWGYSGSGPAQLALALLLDALPVAEPALLLYQKFKEEVVSGLEHSGWFMSQGYVLAWTVIALMEELQERAGASALEVTRDQ